MMMIYHDDIMMIYHTLLQAMLEVIELKVGDKESIFELWWRRLQKILEPRLHLEG